MFPFQNMFGPLDAETVKRTLYENEDNLEPIIEKLPFAGPASERTKISQQNQETKKKEANTETQNEEIQRTRANSMFTASSSEQPKEKRRYSMHSDEKKPEGESFISEIRKRSGSFVEKLKDSVSHLFHRNENGNINRKKYIELDNMEKKAKEENNFYGSKESLERDLKLYELNQENLWQTFSFEPKDEDKENEIIISPTFIPKENDVKKSKESQKPVRKEKKVLGDRTNQVVSDLI